LESLFGGCPVDLRTPRDLSRYFREEVLRQAEVIYADDRVRLQHMLDSASEALSFVQGKSREDLDRDFVYQLICQSFLIDNFSERLPAE
jgi:hypothetical protein